MTDAIASPLSPEDMQVQSMPDASPVKWHLAHTTWFFEQFVLARFETGHRWEDERWRTLFNSYYHSVGPSHSRERRGVLSRPSLEEVRTWRARVNDRVDTLLLRTEDEQALSVVLLGTHHEQQHQELALTDIKHALFGSEMRPVYQTGDVPAFAAGPSSPSVPPGSIPPAPRESKGPLPAWIAVEQRVIVAGAADDDFAFDNERPTHRSIVGPFEMASRLVTNAEYVRFVDDGGYARPELWLSAGWQAIVEEGIGAPLYWERRPAGWRRFSLRGEQPLDADAPVSHVSFFEADAYARWAQARLLTEYEWETAAAAYKIEGHFLESGRLDPAAPTGRPSLYGDTWQWTSSAYLPYPRFRPLEGPLGEYNGKFMSGQMVLRGGSCFSPRDHLRRTYRNYFPPSARWQCTGIRLARDA